MAGKSTKLQRVPKKKSEDFESKLAQKVAELTNRPSRSSKKPKLEVTGQEDLVDELIRINEELESLKTELRMGKETLIKVARDEMRDAERSGTFAQTCIVKGTGQDARVTRVDKFSKIDTSKVDILVDLLGDLYEDLFEQRTEVALKVPFELLDREARSAGIDLSKFLDNRHHISPKKGFLARRAELRPELGEEENVALDAITDVAAYSPRVGFKN